jgi:hypothetical protein
VRMLKRAADVPANFAHSTCPRTWCRSFRCCYWLENSLILIDLGTFILVLPSKPSPNRFDLVTNLVIWCAARHGFTPIGLPERIKFQNRSYILVICRFYCSDRDALSARQQGWRGRSSRSVCATQRIRSVLFMSTLHFHSAD